MVRKEVIVGMRRLFSRLCPQTRAWNTGSDSTDGERAEQHVQFRPSVHFAHG